ncbi:MAG: toxin-antitoxin system YwqK family antitoxin [Bacteroidota bacterium]
MNIKRIKLLFIQTFIVFTPFFAQQDINKTDSQGRKQGYWIKRDDQGFIIYKGSFKDNQPTGTFKYYYPSKDTILKTILIFSKDGKSAKSTNYHFNKALMSTGNYVLQKKDSVWNFFHEGGYKISEETYSNGILNGVSKNYYENGNVLSEYFYKDGKKEGPGSEFFDNGAPKLSGTYKSDNPNGKFTIFYPDGKPYYEGYYVNGLKNMVWLSYNSAGGLNSKEVYNMGQLLEGKEAEAFLNKDRSKPKTNNVKSNTNSKNTNKNNSNSK